MGSKNDPGKFDCYANALPDEPMFILLARDIAASDLVEAWADRLQAAIEIVHKPESDRPKVEEARQCASNMRKWRSDNYGAWRKPKTELETL